MSIRINTSSSQSAVHSAADRHVESMRRAVHNALMAARRDAKPLNSLDQAEVLRAFAGSFVTLEVELTKSLPSILLDTCDAGAKAAIGPGGTLRTGDRVKVRGNFDKTNKASVDWAKRQTAKLVTNISAETRAAIREVITQGFANGVAIPQTAKQLSNLIGMNSVQAKAWAKQFPDPTTSEAQKAAAKYIRDRATTIARTETIRAANAGQTILWQQKVSEGLLPPTALRRWVITPDEKLCPICAGLDGLVAGLTEKFDNEYEYPPAHPRCRCTTALVLTQQPLIEDHFKEVTTPNAPVSMTEVKDILDQEMLRLKSTFSGLKDLKLGKLELIDSTYLPNAAKGQQVGLFSPSHDMIQLATKTLSKSAGALTIGPDAWSTSGASLPGTLNHELGHKLYYKTVVKNKANQAAWKAIVADADIAKAVSKYATTSGAELYAEAFSAYVHPSYQKGQLPKQLEDFFSKVIGNKKSTPNAFVPQPAIPHVAPPLPPPPPAPTPVAHTPPVAPNAPPLGPHVAPKPLAPTKVEPPANVLPPKWFDDLQTNKVGAQAGSNPGGVYVHPAGGGKYYVKLYSNADQAAGEILSNRIYSKIGLSTPETYLGVDSKGKKVFASKWVDQLEATAQHKAMSVGQVNDFMDGFMADVLTANWDAVGLSKDNVGLLSNGGVMRLDQGGTLLYRAQGAPKPKHLLNDITEWDAFFDPAKNKAYSSVAKQMGINSAEDLGPARLQQQLNDLKKLVNDWTKLDDWKQFVAEGSPLMSSGDQQQVAEMLHARMQKLEAKVNELWKPKPKVAPSTQLNITADDLVLSPKEIAKKYGVTEEEVNIALHGTSGPVISPVDQEFAKPAPTPLVGEKPQLLDISTFDQINSSFDDDGWDVKQISKALLIPEKVVDDVIKGTYVNKYVVPHVEELVKQGASLSSVKAHLPQVHDYQLESAWTKVYAKLQSEGWKPLHPGIAGSPLVPSTFNTTPTPPPAVLPAAPKPDKEHWVNYPNTDIMIKQLVSEGKDISVLKSYISSESLPKAEELFKYYKSGGTYVAYSSPGVAPPPVSTSGNVFIKHGLSLDPGEVDAVIKIIAKGGGANAIQQGIGGMYDDAFAIFQYYNTGPGKAQVLAEIKNAPGALSPKPPVTQAPLTSTPSKPDKYSENDVKWMKKLYSEGKSVAQISKQFGSSNTTVIYNIVKEKTWKHVVGEPTGPMPIYGAGPAKQSTPSVSPAKQQKQHGGGGHVGQIPAGTGVQVPNSYTGLDPDGWATKAYSHNKQLLDEYYRPWREQHPQDAIKKITSYTGSSFYGWNDELRANPMLVGQKDTFVKIQRALLAAPSPPPPPVVFRGTSLPKALLDQMWPGGEVQLNGFQSTSVRYGGAWSGNVMMEIKPKHGSWVRPISLHPGEDEFLIPHGMKYRVVAREERNGRAYVKLEML